MRVRVLSTCDSHLPAFVESQMRSLTEFSTKIAYGSCGKCHLRLNPRPQPFTEGKSRKDAERAANHPTGISCLSLPTKEAALLLVVPRQTAETYSMQIRTIRNTTSRKFVNQTFVGHIGFV